MSDRIHPSALGQWATCPKQAYAAMSGRDSAPVPSVAEWVGAYAHAMIAGRLQPDLPRGYTFWDSITPNIQVAGHQINGIAAIVEGWLLEHGYEVHGSELAVESDWVEGTLDLLVKKDVGDTLTIVDVKTGQRVPLGVWHQLGAYADAYNLGHSQPHVSELVVIHAPRTSPREAQPLKAFIRDAYRCAVEARILVLEVDDWMHTRTLDTMPAMPGLGCASCKLDCAVRAWGDE